MIRMLFAVDDSAESRQAVEVFLQHIDWYRDKPEVHLLNVQTPLSSGISSFLKADLIEQYHLDEGLKALASARQRIEANGLVPHVQVVVGNAAESIVRYAADHDCQQILMGSRGLGSAGGWVLGSTATRVLHQSNVPVLILR